MCTKLSVRLFGKLRIQGENDTNIIIESKKALELFSYLLIYRDRPHTRQTLAEANWGDASAAHAKKYLRQALWQFQSVLYSQLDANCPPILIAEPDWVQLNPDAPLWLDVAEFEQAFALAQRKPVYELSPSDFHYLKKAANLYQGDLLEGWYDDWCLYERERLQNMCLTLWNDLMEYCEWHFKYNEALEYGERILRLDVAHERTHRRMLRIYCELGERTEALRQFERCVTALREELGVEPARKTIELYERIRNDRSSIILPRHDTTPPALSSEMLLRRLVRLEKMLVAFENQALTEISAIENALIGSVPKPPHPKTEGVSNQNKTP